MATDPFDHLQFAKLCLDKVTGNMTNEVATGLTITAQAHALVALVEAIRELSTDLGKDALSLRQTIDRHASRGEI